MPFGTASARLKKKIMFMLIKKLGEDICYRCGNKIEDVDELSIEHKKRENYKKRYSSDAKYREDKLKRNRLYEKFGTSSIK